MRRIIGYFHVILQVLALGPSNSWILYLVSGLVLASCTWAPIVAPGSWTFPNNEVLKTDKIAVFKFVPKRYVITFIYNTDLSPSNEWTEKMQGHTFEADLISVDGESPRQNPAITRDGFWMAFKPGTYKLGVRLHDVMRIGRSTLTLSGNKVRFLTVNMEAGHSYVLGVKPINVSEFRSNPTTEKKENRYGEQVTITTRSSVTEADVSAVVYDEVINKIVSATSSANIISPVSVNEWDQVLKEVRKTLSLGLTEIETAGIDGLPNALLSYSVALTRAEAAVKKNRKRLSRQQHSDWKIVSQLLVMYALRIVETYNMKMEPAETQNFEEYKGRIHRLVSDQLAKPPFKVRYLESWGNLKQSAANFGFPDPGIFELN